MNLQIIEAIKTAMMKDPEITPQMILTYFEQSVHGLKTCMAFKPDRETFIAMLSAETEEIDLKKIPNV